MTGSSLIEASSGFSVTRLTVCLRLTSSVRSHIFVDVLHVPPQPIEHAIDTADMHTVGMLLQFVCRNCIALAWSMFQLDVSTLKFLSGSVRSKFVTSELISPQPVTSKNDNAAQRK